MRRPKSNPHQKNKQKTKERANRFECLISEMMMMILGMGDLSAKIKIATLIFYSRRSLISLSFSLQTGVHDVLGNRRRETTTTRGCWDSWSSHFSYPPPPQRRLGLSFHSPSRTVPATNTWSVSCNLNNTDERGKEKNKTQTYSLVFFGPTMKTR